MNNVKLNKMILLGIPLLFLATAVYFFLSGSNVQIEYQGQQIRDQYRETIEYRQGLVLQEISDQFLSQLKVTKDDQDITADIELLTNMNEPVNLGTYTFDYGIDDEMYVRYVVKIVDTTAPVIDGTKSYVAQIGKPFTKENLQLTVYDAYDMDLLSTISLSDIDTSKAGIKKGIVKIHDQSGNESTMEIEIEVLDKTVNNEQGEQLFLQKDTEDLTLLLNPSHVLPDGWEPDDLQMINHDANTAHYLRKEAADAWEQLYAAAKQDGIAVNVVSSFRTQAYQEMLFNSYLEIDPDAASYSARPRSSEHELGLALDLSYDDQLHDDLQTSVLGQWMEKHAYQYGWIVRYPEGKEDITQYIYEPWHYRYVGVPLAHYLHEQNLSLEEYYSNR